MTTTLIIIGIVAISFVSLILFIKNKSAKKQKEINKRLEIEKSYLSGRSDGIMEAKKYLKPTKHNLPFTFLVKNNSSETKSKVVLFDALKNFKNGFTIVDKDIEITYESSMEHDYKDFLILLLSKNIHITQLFIEDASESINNLHVEKTLTYINTDIQGYTNQDYIVPIVSAGQFQTGMTVANKNMELNYGTSIVINNMDANTQLRFRFFQPSVIK